MAVIVKPDVYRAGYESGKRLTGLEDCLDANFVHMAEATDRYLRLGVADYVIGFSDGWHGIEPELS